MGNGCIRFLCISYQNSDSMSTYTSHSVVMGKTVSSGFLKYFCQSFFILKGNDDMHKGLNEFKIRSNRAMDYSVSCP